MKKDIYNTDCSGFILAPATGVKLNSDVFGRIASYNEGGKLVIERLMEINEFSMIAKFLDVINSEKKSKAFIIEYFDAVKKENTDDGIYKDKKPISLPYNKTVRNTLIRSYQ